MYMYIKSSLNDKSNQFDSSHYQKWITAAV